MSSGAGLIKADKLKSIISLPAYILNDGRISLSAKGLYMQIYHSRDSILSIADIEKFTSSSIDEITNYINELVDSGYITKDKKDTFVLNNQAKKVINADIKTELKDKTVAPIVKKNALEFITDTINAETEIPYEETKNLLIDYFVKWLHGEGRFSAQQLHKNMVIGKIKSFVEICKTNKLNQAEMEKCIQQSIDRQWFVFVYPLVNKSKFDKSALVSGSYTMEEKAEIKRKAEERLKNLTKSIEENIDE